MCLDEDINQVDSLNPNFPLSRGVRLLARSPRQTLSSGITIIRSSIPHPPQGHLISLKTRECLPNEKLPLSEMKHAPEIFAGIFFGQVHTLHLARHHRGTFAEEDEIYHVNQGPLATMAKDFDEAIRRVRKVLGWMIAVTRKKGRVSFVGWNGEIVAYEHDLPDNGHGEKWSHETWDVLRKSGIMFRP